MPISSVSYRSGDIVVVPFPYTDRLAEKRRPALVVSGSELLAHGVIWVVMITSASNRSWTCDVVIPDLGSAGLTNPSVVRPAKIACIDPGRIVRRSGRLPQEAMVRVRGHLTRFQAER